MSHLYGFGVIRQVDYLRDGSPATLTLGSLRDCPFERSVNQKFQTDTYGFLTGPPRTEWYIKNSWRDPRFCVIQVDR